jgi:hypothetical protein
MRRPLEAVLVVAALVGAPLSVGLVALSQPAAPGTASAAAVAAPILAGARLSASDCEWRLVKHRPEVYCLLDDGGHCEVAPGHAAICFDRAGAVTVYAILGSSGREP